MHHVALVILYCNLNRRRLQHEVYNNALSKDDAILLVNKLRTFVQFLFILLISYRASHSLSILSRQRRVAVRNQSIRRCQVVRGTDAFRFKKGFRKRDISLVYSVMIVLDDIISSVANPI